MKSSPRRQQCTKENKDQIPKDSKKTKYLKKAKADTVNIVYWSSHFSKINYSIEAKGNNSQSAVT